MNVTLYTISCPKCVVLEKKMDLKGVVFKKVEDIDVMRNLGFSSAPMLDVDGEIMDFNMAIKWISEIGGI